MCRGLTASASRRRGFSPPALYPAFSSDTFHGRVTRWHKTARHYVAVVRVRMTRRVSVSIHLAAGYATSYEVFPARWDSKTDLLIKMRTNNNRRHSWRMHSFRQFFLGTLVLACCRTSYGQSKLPPEKKKRKYLISFCSWKFTFLFNLFIKKFFFVLLKLRIYRKKLNIKVNLYKIKQCITNWKCYNDCNLQVQDLVFV